MNNENSELNSVSVIVSVFNEADTIVAYIDSLLAQTHQELEIVVVDDASTDAKPALLNAYQSEARVKVELLEHNQGVPGARNTGIQISQGDIIAFIDADAEAPC